MHRDAEGAWQFRRAGSGLEIPATQGEPTEYIVAVTIDTKTRQVVVEDGGTPRVLAFDSPEAFEVLSSLWMRCAWETKYLYTFTWFGRPIIQLPDDMFRVQEVLYRLRPDVVIETGVAHGGSLVYYASIFEAMGHGRVIGVDIEIRKHNRAALEAHELKKRIELIEGDSTAKETLERVRALVEQGEKTIVFLDSNHSRAHVSAELEAYAPLVSVGSYIVATDGIMRDVADSPRAGSDWLHDNPYEAARDFVAAHPEFVEEAPHWAFDESAGLKSGVTQWPGAWLRRVR
jgi:cephalosporin hydroxylase